MNTSSRNDNNHVDDNIDILNTQNNDIVCGDGGSCVTANLELQTIDQLKVIADSLCISIKEGSEIIKNDLIERITTVHKRKQDILEKQQYYSNLNSFNKEVIDFKIKDGIDASEWLFWKLFRNKSIYKQIMSNMISTPSYNSIINVTSMIDQVQLNVLRDKVIRNQYISFSPNAGINGEFYDILNEIKNNDDQDTLFYKQLFKNYNFQFSPFGILINVDNGIEQLAKSIISCNCIPAFNALIEYYQYKPTNDDLRIALDSDDDGASERFEIVKILSQPKFNLQLPNLNDIHKFKTLNHFYNISPMEIYVLQSHLKRINKQFYGKTKLKSLIEISLLILKCDTNSITTLEEIKTFSKNLTSQELCFELAHKSNQIEPKRKTISKLIQLYYSFINLQKPQFYYIYFCGIGETYDRSFLLPSRELYLSSFRFADFKLMQTVSISCNDLTIKSLLNAHLKEPDILFSHCREDKKKQIEFINLMVNEIKSNAEKEYDPIDSNLFFNLMVYNNDLDQIKHVAKELNIKDIVNYDIVYMITRYIRSTLVLDWLFENGLMLNCGNRSKVWYFRDVQLLQHFEKLQLKSENGTIKLSLPLHELYPFNVHVLKHILKSGSMIYNFGDILVKEKNNYVLLDIIGISGYCTNDKFELLKSIYLNLGIDQVYCFLDNIVPRDLKLSTKFIKWFYTNFQDEYNNSNELKEDKTVGQTLLKIGINNKQTNECCLEYILQDPNECKIEHLEYILNDTGNTYYTSMVTKILSNACTYGKLNAIHHIHLHFDWLLKKKSELNQNGLFTMDELNSFLKLSLENNQLVLSEYLFELFPITKEEFDICCGDFSRSYFRNKSFK